MDPEGETDERERIQGGRFSLAPVLWPPGPGARSKAGRDARRRWACLRRLLAVHHAEDQQRPPDRRGAG